PTQCSPFPIPPHPLARHPSFSLPSPFPFLRRPPPRSTLFPYTTLFRSDDEHVARTSGSECRRRPPRRWSGGVAVASAPASDALGARAPPCRRGAESPVVGAVLAPGVVVRPVRLARAGPHRRTSRSLCRSLP